MFAAARVPASAATSERAQTGDSARVLRRRESSLPIVSEDAPVRCCATPSPESEPPCVDLLDTFSFLQDDCSCCSAPQPGATIIHSKFGRVRAELCRGGGGGGVSAVGASAIPAGTRNALATGQQRFEKSKEVPKQNDIEVHNERVTCVLGKNPNHYTLNGTNCWLVGSGKQRLLIDTGEHQQREEFLANLKDAMARVGCEGLSAILITHMHGDHTGGIDTLQKEFGPGIPVLKGPAPKHHVRSMEQIIEHGVLEHLQDKVRPRDPTWGGVDPLEWDELGRTREELKRDFGSIQMHWNNHRKMVDEWKYRELRDDEVIECEGATLRAMHTPGHASDHVAFWLEEEEAIFTGDHVLGYGTTSVMDVSSYMKSIYRMRALRPDHLYPGHGPHVKEAIELLNRYILHRTSREKQVLDVLAEERTSSGLTTRELVDRLYTDVNTEKLRMAMENIQKIVMKLGKEGKALPLRLAPASTLSQTTAAAANAKVDATARMQLAAGAGAEGKEEAEEEGEGAWSPYAIPWYLSMGHELPSNLRWTLGELEEDEDEGAAGGGGGGGEVQETVQPRQQQPAAVQAPAAKL
eukprot:COSAG06_NODE_4549_length_4156_cov_5.190781_2_plen_579_part_00